MVSPIPGIVVSAVSKTRCSRGPAKTVVVKTPVSFGFTTIGAAVESATYLSATDFTRIVWSGDFMLAIVCQYWSANPTKPFVVE